MKRFLKYFVIFTSPILLAAICFEILLQCLPNDYRCKKQALDAEAGKMELLFLGNSHIYYGIDPTYIHCKSYNAAYVSQSLDYDLAILQKYQNDLKNLNCIVLSVDYSSLYYTLEHSVESWRRKNYNLYYDIHQGFSIAENSELLSNNFMVNLKRVYGYNVKGRNPIGATKLGWGSDYHASESKDLESSGKAAAKRHIQGKDQALFKENLETIRQIVDFADKRKIKVVFITSPAYKTYTSHLEPHGFDNTVAAMSKLVKSKPNLQYFNFMEDASFVKEDFYDGDHLNEIGAKKFSIKVDSLLCPKK